MHSGTTTVHQLMVLHTDTPRQGRSFTPSLLLMLDGPPWSQELLVWAGSQLHFMGVLVSDVHYPTVHTWKQSRKTCSLPTQWSG